ncbi:MAG: hypothetical protein ACI4RE_04795, partial [Christensenellales bacterium]
RKSTAGQVFCAAVAAFANALHKTDGSYVNRPFFVSSRTRGKAVLLKQTTFPRNVFCFFKRNRPP